MAAKVNFVLLHRRWVGLHMLSMLWELLG